MSTPPPEDDATAAAEQEITRRPVRYLRSGSVMHDDYAGVPLPLFSHPIEDNHTTIEGDH
ncbi:MAG: hypothetical protein WCP28_07185 [Actinomycetes bacterium]